MDDGKIVAEFDIEGQENLGDRREVGAHIIVKKFDSKAGTFHIIVEREGKQETISIAPFFDSGSVMLPSSFGVIFEGREMTSKQFRASELKWLLEKEEELKTIREAWRLLNEKE